MNKNTSVAIDIGNITSIGVSNEKEVVIESRIKELEVGIDDFNLNENFECDGIKYISNSGKFENDLLKFNKENYLPLLYYSISKSTESNLINLITAIPASQYKKKEEMKNFIEKNNKKTLIVDGKLRTITINRVEILPESYAIKTIKSLMNKINRNTDTIVVDIGGGTVDISNFDNNMNLKNANSIAMGLINIYQNTREYLNITYDLNMSLEEAKRIFDGEQQLLNGKSDYKPEIVKRFIRALVNEIRGLYPNLKNSNIILVGGGSNILYPTFSKLYPQTIMNDEVKLQCQGLFNIAEKLFK
jgi:plasmid segregation protein ParM